MEKKHINTQDDQELLFRIILGQVFKDYRINYQDKYDCAMDILMSFIVDNEGEPKKAKIVNRSYIYSRVGDRVTTWINKAYRRYEGAQEINDHIMPVTNDTNRGFLYSSEIKDISEDLGPEVFNTFNALFGMSKAKVAKRDGVSTSTVATNRKKFMDKMKTIARGKYNKIYEDIKKDR
jgi:hypothetical protein